MATGVPHARARGRWASGRAGDGVCDPGPVWAVPHAEGIVTDMLVRLYDLPADRPEEALLARGIVVKRALALDAGVIGRFVDAEFGGAAPGWVHECQAALVRQPPACFIAERSGALLGFACFDATAKGMFGPVGVAPSARGLGIGRALLLACLRSMAAEGYAYAVIGWAHREAYYRDAVGAVPIAGSEPGLYRRALGR